MPLHKPGIHGRNGSATGSSANESGPAMNAAWLSIGRAGATGRRGPWKTLIFQMPRDLPVARRND